MSAITSVVQLYPNILPEVPGCPTPLLLQIIQEVIRDFCVQSDLWRETKTYSLVADQVTYTLGMTATGAEIQRVVEVKISDVVQNVTLYSFDITTLVLTLDSSIKPTAAVTNGLSVKTSLRTTYGYPTTTWDSGFLNRYLKAICDGAKARLMLMPNRKWSSPQEGYRYLQQYQTEVALARRECWFGNKNGTLSVRPRTW
jgi:hypothetical protein